MYYKRLSGLSEVRTNKVLLNIFLFKKSLLYFYKVILLLSLVLSINYKFFLYFIIVDTFFFVSKRKLSIDIKVIPIINIILIFIHIFYFILFQIRNNEYFYILVHFLKYGKLSITTFSISQKIAGDHRGTNSFTRALSYILGLKS